MKTMTKTTTRTTTTKTSKALGFLGLLYLGRKAIIGEELLNYNKPLALLVAANDLTSGTALKELAKFERAGYQIDKTYSMEELGEALGHQRVSFIGIIGKKAALSYLAKIEEEERI